MANCASCRHFIPEHRLSKELREWCLKWIEVQRPGAPLYGYCTEYDRPVTYLEGSCLRYTPKFNNEKCLKLDEWMLAPISNLKGEEA